MSDRHQSISPKLSCHTLSIPLILIGGMWLGIIPQAAALPPASDVPEEILRTEIITQGRSPIDGTPLTPAEYATLLEDPAFQGTIAPNNGNQPTAIGPIRPGQIMINRLPVRELLRVIFPF